MPDYTLTKDPKPAHHAAPRQIYPFADMGVDDCAVFAEDGDFRKINRAAHQVGANHGKKFTVRRCADKKIRVWRIA